MAELLLEENDEFVEAAYLALLKRRPDATGGRAYLQALHNGTSKLQILHELSISEDCKLDGGEIPGLGEALAQERNGLANSAPAEASQITNADQLLTIDGDKNFIGLAYWILLRRAPDPAGMASYHAKLQAGTSRVQFLYEIFTSPEGRLAGVKIEGLRERFAQGGLNDVVDEMSRVRPTLLPSTTTSAELIKHHGKHFVENAYQALLQRAPDAHEVELRLRQLNEGCTKIQILSEISPPGKAQNINSGVTGLAFAITLHKLSRIPVLGVIACYLFGLEGDSNSERRSRALEHRLSILTAEVEQQIAEMATRIKIVVRQEQRSLLANDALKRQVLSLETSVALLGRLIECQTDRAHGAGVAPDISSVRLALELRKEAIARDLRRRH